MRAPAYHATLEHRARLKVGCPEEVAWRLGWIGDDQLETFGPTIKKSGYGKLFTTPASVMAWIPC